MTAVLAYAFTGHAAFVEFDFTSGYETLSM